MTTHTHAAAGQHPLTVLAGPCPDCGGPPVPLLPHATARVCLAGTALIVAGQTITHLGPGETLPLSQDLATAGRCQ